METKLFLNTWGAYNNGNLGYGWMTPEEALEFIDKNPNKDGGEYFIADIDNYLDIDFGNLDYANVEDICNSIIELEDMDSQERDEIIALMDILSCDYDEAVNSYSCGDYIFYTDVQTYYDCCDELIENEINCCSDIVSRYFDYDAYHRDCMYDVTEAKNGIVVSNY